ncbi:hypothetical protein RRG08_059785 [Elysia crispata]|uniref:Uncharacterized protein n=1 Tax=Elysia crispata TaxID=231223 RepID=A0AAE1BEB0_9GAST|nr:hypothetical protein RRG08_059785 [Elysia crispata]
MPNEPELMLSASFCETRRDESGWSLVHRDANDEVLSYMSSRNIEARVAKALIAVYHLPSLLRPGRHLRGPQYEPGAPITAAGGSEAGHPGGSPQTWAPSTNRTAQLVVLFLDIVPDIIFCEAEIGKALQYPIDLLSHRRKFSAQRNCEALTGPGS